MVEKGLNYFGSSERRFENWFCSFRHKLFAPLCKLLFYCRISPNMVTLFGLSMLIGVWIFFSSWPKLAFVFLALYVFFDGIDGCAARNSKTSSNAGSFLDIVCDQTGMAVVAILAMANGFVSVILGGTYIYAYCLMIVVTVVRNLLNDSPRWILRTKYFLFITYGIWAFGFGDYFQIFFWVATPLTVLFAFIGCVRLYWRLKRVY